MLNTEKRIIDAALELFAEKGFEATSIRDIALLAGINSATLYHYMKTKEDFLFTLMKKGLEDINLIAIEIQSTIGNPLERIATLIKVHVMIHGQKKRLTSVTDTEFRSLHGESKEIIQDLRKAYETIWFNTINEGINSQYFKAVTNPKITTIALLEMCTSVAHWYSANGLLTLAEIADEFVIMGLNLLGTPLDSSNISVADAKIIDFIDY